MQFNLSVEKKLLLDFYNLYWIFALKSLRREFLVYILDKHRGKSCMVMYPWVSNYQFGEDYSFTSLYLESLGL